MPSLSLRRAVTLFVVIGVAGLLLGCGDDPSGPEDPTATPPGPTATPTPPPATPTPTPDDASIFPATYQGEYWFDNLPYVGVLTFVITAEATLTGNWHGQDIEGNSWTLSLEGWVKDGQLHLAIHGWYSVIPCEVWGEANGASADQYRSFTGSWAASECHGLTIRGGWWANRVAE